MRRTGYTRGGEQVVVNFRYGAPSSYRIVGRPLVRRSEFLVDFLFFDALRRVLSPAPRPKGLPRV